MTTSLLTGRYVEKTLLNITERRCKSEREHAVCSPVNYLYRRKMRYVQIYGSFVANIIPSVTLHFRKTCCMYMFYKYAHCLMWT
jgi:hypothetical protein